MARDNHDTLPEARHLTIHHVREIYGDIWLDEHDHPHFRGKEETLQHLWLSITRQGYYKNLTPPQVLGRMLSKLRGPVWAEEVK